MITALVTSTSYKAIIKIDIYFDIQRNDICFNAFYPDLKTIIYDLKHFRYDSKMSNEQIASHVLLLIQDIAREDENRKIYCLEELEKHITSINYHSIFRCKQFLYKKLHNVNLW